MHPSYYYRAHACVLVRVRCAPSRSRDVGVSRWWWWWWCVCQAFDVTRKSTYQHLSQWYKELRTYCENIPVVLVANKIDVDYKVCVWLFGCVCGAWQHQWVGASITMAHHSRWVGQVTKKKFNFSKKHKLPFFFVSAAVNMSSMSSVGKKKCSTLAVQLDERDSGRLLEPRAQELQRILPQIVTEIDGSCLQKVSLTIISFICKRLQQVAGIHMIRFRKSFEI